MLVLPLVSAVNLRVEKQSSDEVLIPDLDKFVVFDLRVTNLGQEDSFKFYNLLGFEMFPKGTVYIGQGQSKNIQLKILPIGEFSIRGSYTFNYLIRGQDDSEQNEKITFRVRDIDGAFEIGSGEIDPVSNSMKIYIYNTLNFDFGNMSAKFSSPFFDIEEDFSLGPKERKEFTVELDKSEFKKLMAGFYTLTGELSIQDKTTSVEGIIKFVEKDILTTTKKEYGLVISTLIITKTNEGNVAAESETIIKKNIISRLFTSFSPEPDSVDRDGFKIYYTWAREINPGEGMEIIVKTNWLFPFLIIILLIVIVVLIKKYSTTHLVLRKKVSFVKTKGADFGLKVSVFVHARKYVERISVTDRLPPLVKVYEKFGVEKPTRVSQKKRSVEWDFEKLEAGETRVLNYIIYSKVGVLGRFALPATTAVYERDGKIQEAESNKAFFVAEQRKRDIEEG